MKNNFIYFFFLFILSNLLYVSCGTYQYSGYINDGIYENSDDVYAENEENKPNKNIPDDYYKNYFDEVSTSYSNLNNDLFTDTDEYVTSERDSVQSKYGPWGSNINSVEINIHSNYNDSFWTRWHYPNWMWNYGYGYGNVWGWGYNNYWSRPYPYFNGFYDPFNPFWGYYNSFYYGYGYGGYPYWYSSYWRPHNYWNHSYFYGSNYYNNYSFVSSRRGSSSFSSRNGFIDSNISRRYNNSTNNLSSLTERLNRIESINSSARINPELYKPYNRGNNRSNNYTRNNSNNNNSRTNNYSNQNSSRKPANSGYTPTFNNSNFNSGSRSNSSYSRGSSGSYNSGGRSGGSSSGGRRN